MEYILEMNYFLTVIWLSHGQIQVIIIIESVTNPMLIIVFCQFWTPRSPAALYQGWAHKSGQAPRGI